MNYGELRQHFLDLLNRDDCSNELADRFIAMGLRRVERLLRTPIQRATRTETVGEGAWQGHMDIPSDYIAVYAVRVNDVDWPRITTGQRGTLEGYYTQNGEIFFSPELTEGDEVTITYYTEFFTGVDDDVITDYSLVLPDIAAYAALAFAGDYFIDQRLDRWETTMAGLVQELQDMADKDDMAGLSMQPMGGGII